MIWLAEMTDNEISKLKKKAMIHELKRLYSPIFVTRVDWLNYILFTDHLCGIWGC